MNQIAPQRDFVIIWNSADPLDTDTLYVQAKVYDSLTRALLATVPLTDRGSNLFTASYTTPADTSQTGTGRQIYIIKTVYTDSGYSTPSANYQRITDDYLVKLLPDANNLGGGAMIGYNDLKKALAEVLTEKNITFDPPKVIDYPVVLKQDFPIAAIKTAIAEGVAQIENSIRNIPEPEEVEMPEMPDLKPLEAGMERIMKSIKVLPTENDITPILDAMSNLSSLIKENKVNIQNSITDYLENNKGEFLPAMVEGIADIVVGRMKEQLMNLMLGQLMGKNNDTQEKRKQYLDNLMMQFK